MGGSAIGADLVTTYVSSTCPVPVSVHRDYGLPAFAKGKETLMIASSHSGNTEETLEAFETALKNDCTVLVICTGGELAKRAKEKNIPVWTFHHTGQPRAAVGFSFGLLLALFARLKLIPDPAQRCGRNGRRHEKNAGTPPPRYSGCEKSRQTVRGPTDGAMGHGFWSRPACAGGAPVQRTDE